MKSFEQCVEVELLFDGNYSIDQICTKTGIPRTTIDRCKQEYDLAQKIKEMIDRGEIDEARSEMKGFTTKYGRAHLTKVIGSNRTSYPQ